MFKVFVFTFMLVNLISACSKSEDSSNKREKATAVQSASSNNGTGKIVGTLAIADDVPETAILGALVTVEGYPELTAIA